MSGGAQKLTKQLKVVNTHHHTGGHKTSDGDDHHRFTVAITVVDGVEGRKPNYSYTYHLAAAATVCSDCCCFCFDNAAAAVDHMTAAGGGDTAAAAADLSGEVILTAYSLLSITSWAATTCCC